MCSGRELLGKAAGERLKTHHVSEWGNALINGASNLGSAVIANHQQNQLMQQQQQQQPQYQQRDYFDGPMMRRGHRGADATGALGAAQAAFGGADAVTAAADSANEI